MSAPAGSAARRAQAARVRQAAGAARQRAPIEADLLYLGWQYALPEPDPGPMPRRPAPTVLEQLSEPWLAAQRREERRIARPLKLAGGLAAALACAVLALWLAGLLNAALTVVGEAAFVGCAAACGRGIWLGEQQLRSAVEAEKRRIARVRIAQQDLQAVRLDAHASQYRGWQQRRAAFSRQPRWYAVSLPAGIDRVDIAGGTLAGWSAMLTMLAAPRLGAGGEVTVLDLTEGAVAADLLAVARRSGVEPHVWVLPGDLPLLDVGARLRREALADVLVQTVSAGDEQAAAAETAARDAAILDRVLEVLGDGARIAQVSAALRALAQIGDPREDVRGGLLTPAQLDRITAMFGRGATDKVVIERAWALESRLRKLDKLGSALVSLPPSRLRVAWLDRRSGVLGNQVLGTYLTVAITHLLRQAPAAAPWQHTLCVFGAERLRAEVLDRLQDACELSRTGLVTAYRSIPAPVAGLGRGNAAVAFMRLGNAQDARAASEQIGTEHRFVLSQLTETVGSSLTDTSGDSYTSTVGTADSVADSVSVSETDGQSRGRGRSGPGGFAPFGDFTGTASRDASYSRGSSDSRSITESINEGTSWGQSTSRAVGATASLARGSQRSREFLVEQHELQQLPPTAVIISYDLAAGRQVVLADANPAIMALPGATLLSLDQARAAAAARSRRLAQPATPAAGLPAFDDLLPDGGGPGSGPGGAGAGPGAAEPPPNLGRPPERLDWRRR